MTNAVFQVEASEADDRSGETVAPLVSVVIATYRRADALMRAVRCVLGQTFRDLELLVVSEIGDDDTPKALANVGDPRLRHVLNPRKRGPGVARDHGAAAARGHWVAFLDDDDEWLPTKVEKQLDAVKEGESVVCMTLSNVVMPSGTIVQPTLPFDGKGNVDEWLFSRRTWFKGGESFLQTSSLMMPRALLSQVGFGEVRHEEWELVIRAVKQLGYTLRTVPEPLVVYYTGNTYPIEGSLRWIDSVRDLLTPEAYSGFCLTVATHGVQAASRNRAFITLLSMAVKRGRPTARQLFAFGLIWLLPDPLRQRIRIAVKKFKRRPAERAEAHPYEETASGKRES